MLSSDADGFDGTDASVSNGFANINRVLGSASATDDALTGLDAAATWQIAGDPDNVYASDGNNLGFENFEALSGGNDIDTFELGGGTHAGNLTIDGNGGSDTANVVADFGVSGDLSISDVESLTDAGGILSASQLSVAGASNGIGSNAAALQTDVDAIQISGSGDVYIAEQNALDILGIGSAGVVDVMAEGDLTQSGDIDTQGGAVSVTGSSITMAADAATRSCNGGCPNDGDGDITYLTTGDGDLVVGLLDAGSPNTDPNSTPDRGNSGTVTLTSLNGSILSARIGAGLTNIRGSDAVLEAPNGRVGTVGDPIRIIVPLVQGTPDDHDHVGTGSRHRQSESCRTERIGWQRD